MRQQRKISRDEWAAISARHAQGESLASIGRAYDCTAPAIRYILRQAGKPGPADTNDQAAAEAARFGHHAGDELAADPSRAQGRRGGTRSKAKSASGTGQRARFDPGLREAITLEISAFLVTFDAVMDDGTPAAFDRLRDATDRLMRAAARVRIELERKE